MAVNINVPSQVKTYANLAAFPATGALKTIYIAEDTNKTYRWTGSVYTEISASASGITIGSTAIASGVVGRVLFEGAGNVVQESSSLFWDATNNRLGIGTSTPTAPLQVVSSDLVTALFVNTGNDGGLTAQNNGTLANNRTSQVRLVNGSTIFGANDRTYQLVNIGKSSSAADFLFQYWDGSSYLQRFTIFSTGNVAINTTTDAGFRLDVNGTARVQGNAQIGSRLTIGTSGTSYGTYIETTGGGGFMNIVNGTSGGFTMTFTNSNAERMRIASTGNILINTTTDAGFRLDVNGTARVQTSLEVAGASGITFGGGVSVLSYSGTTLNIGNSATWADVSLFAGGVQKYSQTASLTTISNTTINLSTATVQLAGVNALTYSGTDIRIGSVAAGFNSLSMYVAGSERARIASTGNLLINTTTDVASSLLTLESTTKGFLPPRMTTTQKNAIATPATGLQVYDTTLNQMSYYNGTTWTNI